jgi:GntR family transcriptional regulator
MDDLQFTADYATCDADEDLAAAFDAPDERAPFGVGRSFLVYDMIASNKDLLDASSEPWPGGTQHQLYTVGIEIGRIVDDVTARPRQRTRLRNLASTRVCRFSSSGRPPLT